MTIEYSSLPLGVAIPADTSAAAELIEEALEQAREEQAARELLREREQEMAWEV